MNRHPRRKKVNREKIIAMRKERMDSVYERNPNFGCKQYTWKELKEELL